MIGRLSCGPLGPSNQGRIADLAGLPSNSGGLATNFGGGVTNSGHLPSNFGVLGANGVVLRASRRPAYHSVYATAIGVSAPAVSARRWLILTRTDALRHFWSLPIMPRKLENNHLTAPILGPSFFPRTSCCGESLTESLVTYTICLDPNTFQVVANGFCPSLA